MKKNLLLSIACLFTISFSYAQFERGQKLLTGGISFSTANSKNAYSTMTDNSNVNFNFDVSLGKFIRPDKLVGFGINYGNSSRHQNDSVNSYKQNYNSIGAFYYTTYYKTIAKNLYGWISWNAGANYNFSSNSSSQVYPDYVKSTGYGIGVNIVPGISYKINKRFLFNASLNSLLSLAYTHTQTSYSNSESSGNSFGFSSSLSNGILGNIGIGFSILLNKK